MQPNKLPPVPVSRSGDWNKVNTFLLEETRRMGGNPYRAKYLQAMKNKEWSSKKSLWVRLLIFLGCRCKCGGKIKDVYGYRWECEWCGGRTKSF